MWSMCILNKAQLIVAENVNALLKFFSCADKFAGSFNLQLWACLTCIQLPDVRNTTNLALVFSL